MLDLFNSEPHYLSNELRKVERMSGIFERYVVNKERLY